MFTPQQRLNAGITQWQRHAAVFWFPGKLANLPSGGVNGRRLFGFLSARICACNGYWAMRMTQAAQGRKTYPFDPACRFG
jgi:hypothetical protein